MDLTESIQPRSDQINADDLIAGPMTVTIREVIKGAAEQPFDFKLVESERVYRPSKTSRRVIVAAWGAEAANYAGRRLTLYREPSITYGGKVVGGIRVSHLSHIDGPLEVMAQTTRGKREKFVVQPLADPMDDVPFVPQNAAPAALTAESPAAAQGQTAAEPASAPGAAGGLIIDSAENALLVIGALQPPQLLAMKALLGFQDKATKRELADALLDQYAEWFQDDVIGQLATDTSHDTTGAP